MDVGPLSPMPPGVSLEMAGARLAAAFGRCAHPNAVPVESVDGERVATFCPDCDTQLPAEWETVEP